MKSKIDPVKIKLRMTNELISLGRILAKHCSEVVRNPEVLNSAANQCKSSGSQNWSYEVPQLEFQVLVPQNILPLCDAKTLIITANLDLRGIFDDDAEDCLTHLMLNIRIETEDKESFCSWHFDRHITSPGSPDAEEAHPLYHFQHGGHAMKEIADSLGKVLLLPAPRLGFPPMDATLSIDFLLSNFAGTAWQELRNDTSYTQLLQAAQKRHWKPYIDRLASWWDQGYQSEANKEKTRSLWPHLV